MSHDALLETGAVVGILRDAIEGSVFCAVFETNHVLDPSMSRVHKIIRTTTTPFYDDVRSIEVFCKHLAELAMYPVVHATDMAIECKRQPLGIAHVKIWNGYLDIVHNASTTVAGMHC